jgi:DNA-directed RNA polymerase specialized sigma24 family protein
MRADFKAHLSQILTPWSLVFRAHQDSGLARQAAQAELLCRYSDAISRYLRSVVKDENVVEELVQQFAFRFIRGDFHRAHPAKGRFRDFVKKAVIHLIADWWREQNSRPRPLDSAVIGALASGVPEAGQQFEDQWRAELITQTWKRFAEVEAARPGSWLCVALRQRVEHPEQSAADMADQLGRQLALPLTEANVWKTLERARKKFASLLLEEVARSLGELAHDELRNEVMELGLQSYFQPALG